MDPNNGMDDVRAPKRAVGELGVRAAGCFPSGTNPQIAIDAPHIYPLYAKCVELDIPMFITRRRARAARADGGPARRASSTRSATTSPS